MRILALDHGGRYIGVAISDPEKTIAFPREVFEYKNEIEIIEYLKKIISQEKIGEIVVGWPLSMGGNETEQTRKTNTFIELLEANLSLSIKKMDERWTTAQAKRSDGDHSVAAQIILQTYLDMIK